MKPDNLINGLEIAEFPPRELYSLIYGNLEKGGDEVAVKQSKPSTILTYNELIENADFLSRSIPFEDHPVELDMNPSASVIIAVVAVLKRGCRPVSSDKTSKVKLIINDNLVRINGNPHSGNPFVKYMVKGMRISRPELEFEHRRQLRRQDFIDDIIRTLVRGGKIIIKDKD